MRDDRARVLAAEAEFQRQKDKSNYLGFYQRVTKRIFDVMAGCVAAPFVLVIAIPVAIAIKIEDGGPVFYRSMRLGEGFREFGMLKFRSMRVNAPDVRNDDGSTFNAKDDPRVTRVGRFLRESSLDEIPQVFNILVGDMSVVGPRPGDVESKDTYREDERDKMLVRPGITGYCQVYFRNAAGVREKRLHDAAYAHAVTFGLDARIFVKTITTVLKRENLYTNTKEQFDAMANQES